MSNIDTQDILRLLALGEGQNIIWSLFLYIIFFLGLICLLLMPEKNMTATLLIGAVLMMAVVAKVSLASDDPILTRRSFGMMIINVLMGVFPIIVAGMVRSGKVKSKVQGPAIITGIFGIIYFFMFYLFVQR